MLFCVRKLFNDIGYVWTCIVIMEQNVLIVLIMKGNKLLTQFIFQYNNLQWGLLSFIASSESSRKMYPGKMNTRVTLSFNLIINKLKIMSFSTIDLFPFLWLLFLNLISLEVYCDLNNYHKLKIRKSIFSGYIELKT